MKNKVKSNAIVFAKSRIDKQRWYGSGGVMKWMEYAIKKRLRKHCPPLITLGGRSSARCLMTSLARYSLDDRKSAFGFFVSSRS